jgi:hypothetical protein
VRPLCLCNGAFDGYVIYLSVIVLALPLGGKIGVAISGNCEDCAKGWESFALLQPLGLVFDLRVIAWPWVGNLWSWWRICDL